MDSWIHLLTKKIPAYGFPCVFADKAACLYFIFLYVHPLGCTLYVVLRLQESVCQKDKEKNRRTRTDSLNGRALYNWVQPCRGILKIYAEYFAFFPLIVCLNSHYPLRAKCDLDHETTSRTDRGNTLAHAPNRPIKDDLLNELARKAG